MSAYEELLQATAVILSEDGRWPPEAYLDQASRVLSLMRRTLETVTPEMDAAFKAAPEWDDQNDIWLAMLRASPLEPPK
jgi:hypothetical protein